MSKTRSRGDEAGAGASKGKLAAVAVACAVLGAVGGPKLLGSSAPAAATEQTTTTVAEGPVVVLDKVTLNLSDGHLLQVGLALELSAGAGRGDDHGPPAEDDPTKGYAKALDAAIGVLGDSSLASLSAPGGRTGAKEALQAELAELYDGEITGVYFHTFVMQ